jgi:hypothetical protein
MLGWRWAQFLDIFPESQFNGDRVGYQRHAGFNWRSVEYKAATPRRPGDLI